MKAKAMAKNEADQIEKRRKVQEQAAEIARAKAREFDAIQAKLKPKAPAPKKPERKPLNLSFFQTFILNFKFLFFRFKFIFQIFNR